MGWKCELHEELLLTVIMFVYLPAMFGVLTGEIRKLPLPLHKGLRSRLAVVRSPRT